MSEGISAIKNNFEEKLRKSIKSVNVSEEFKISYRNDEAAGFIPVFTLKVNDPIKGIEAMKACYDLIFDSIVGTEYQSLKYMMLTRYFAKVYFITEINGNLFDYKWLSFPLHIFLDTTFESLPVDRFQTEDIDAEISTKLKLKTWLSILPGAKVIRTLAAQFERLKLYLGHLSDLKFFNENEQMDKMGNAMIIKHVENVGHLINELWNDLLEGLIDLAKDFQTDDSDIVDPEEHDFRLLRAELVNDLVPQEAELGSGYFDFQSLSEWSIHINSLGHKWGMFLLLLQKKILVGFNNRKHAEIP